MIPTFPNNNCCRYNFPNFKLSIEQVLQNAHLAVSKVLYVSIEGNKQQAGQSDKHCGKKVKTGKTL